MSLPQALSESLVTRWVDGELIIIDQATNAVHCLPDVAARVFMQCNSRQTPEEIAVAEGLDLVQVTAVLEQIGDAGLLATAPGKLALTRRVFAGRTVRTAAIAVGAAPLITSLLLPAAAHASGTASTCAGTCSSSSGTYAAASEEANASCAYDNRATGCGSQATCVISYRSSGHNSQYPYYVRGHCAS